MKQFLFLLSFSFASVQFLNGQKNDSSAKISRLQLHDTYIQKHKTNKTVAWIMLGLGVGAAATGAYIDFREHVNSTYNGTGKPIFYLGAATALASIPIFIAAGQNKRKAKLTLKEEAVSIRSKSLPNSHFTAIAFTIRL